MSQTINTNIASLTAQRNLNNSASSLNTSLERLSSGLRINSARDDAAGLAISERFTSQIRGLDQAARNSNDGISLAQTAEGALAEITNNLQRIRELSVQSANATNSSSDRAALQAEVSELLEEIDRVASETSFNGVNLLDGSFDAQTFQVGANAGQTISIDEINSARTSVLGEVVQATITGTAITGDVSGLQINGQTVADSTSALELAANIEAAASDVSAEITDGAVTFTQAATTGQATSFELNGTLIDLGTTTDTGANIAAAFETAINSANISNISVSVTGADVTITGENGANVVIASSSAGASAADATTRGSVELTSAANIEVASAGTSGLAAGTALVAGNGSFLSDLNISSVDGATSALSSVDAALTTINSSRAELGAIQNRFESVVRSLQTTSENLSASRSRIQDADFASETANLTRAQILQQAGTSVLAQANALPQNVLSLLQ